MKTSLLALFAAAAVPIIADKPHLPHPAGLIPRQSVNATTGSRRLLVGAKGQIFGLDFNGTAFTKGKANVTEPTKVAIWMAFKPPNFLYAVDEMSSFTRLFNYNPETGDLSTETQSWNASAGVFHLAFNLNQTRLIGSSYAMGQLDIWDSSSADGALKYLKTVVLDGEHGTDPVSQLSLHPHQAVLDPSGRFFAVNDLGGDSIHILDSANDAWTLNGRIGTGNGCGPRHGAFLSLNGGLQASHYLVVCELSNMIIFHSVKYTENSMEMTAIQFISGFVPGFGPTNDTSATLAEIQISTAPGPAYVYVSTRDTINSTDSIHRFSIEKPADNSTGVQLVPKDWVGTGGAVARHFSLSKDSEQEFIFVGNKDGQNGIAAIKRCTDDGCALPKTLTGKLDNLDIVPFDMSGKKFGPQFVMEF